MMFRLILESKEPIDGAVFFAYCQDGKLRPYHSIHSGNLKLFKRIGNAKAIGRRILNRDSRFRGFEVSILAYF